MTSLTWNQIIDSSESPLSIPEDIEGKSVLQAALAYAKCGRLVGISKTLGQAMKTKLSGGVLPHPRVSRVRFLLSTQKVKEGKTVQHLEKQHPSYP